MTTSIGTLPMPIKTVTYSVTLKHPDGSVVPGFSVRVPRWRYNGAPVLEETELHPGGIADPVTFEIPHKSMGGFAPRLAIRGPADPAHPDIKNYQHEIYLFRRTGGAIDFVLTRCSTRDLFDGASLCHQPQQQTPNARQHDQEPEMDLVSVATAKGTPDFSDYRLLACCQVDVSVKNDKNQHLPGYSTQLQIHDVAPLTLCSQIDPKDTQGKTFLVRKTKTTTWVYLYESATGRRVARTPVSLMVDGNVKVTFVLAALPEPVDVDDGTIVDTPGEVESTLKRHERLIEAPAMIRHHYTDGSDRGMKPATFVKHGIHDHIRSSLAASIERECKTFAKAWVALHHTDAQAVRLLAFENAAEGYFQIGPWGGDYQWLACKWSPAEFLGEEIARPTVVVERLLVEWWA